MNVKHNPKHFINFKNFLLYKLISMFKKILFQPIRPYVTTQPIAFQLKQHWLAQLAGWKPFSSIMYQFPNVRKLFTDIDVNERIVEIPFIFQSITKQKSTILDIGCLESTVGLSLATLGHQVTGIDIRPMELTHPNFTFIQEDICETTLKKNQFDYVLLLSTLEHIGLDTIYGKVTETSSDQKTLEQVYKLLKPGGKLLLTIPYCKTYWYDNFMRRYNQQTLKKRLKKFNIVTQHFFASHKRAYWYETSEQEMPDKPEHGVTLIVGEKKI